MLDKYILKSKTPKNYPILKITILLFIIFIIFSSTIKTYDSYNIIAILNCSEKCTINFSLPYNKIPLVNPNAKINYNNKVYDVKNIKFDEPYLNNNVPYQDLSIETEIQEEEKILNIKLLNNKQRIITKLYNMITERE